MATDTINTGNNVAAEEVLPKPWGLQISYEYRDVLHNKLVDYFPCRSILLQRIAMFTTFPASTVRQDQDDNDGRFGPVSNTRPRRHQVSRACGWCRALRIKCDDQIPCRNCTAKRRKCEQKGANELRTFSLAVKEIERLKCRVADLEGQLISCRGSPETQAPHLPENLDPLKEHGANRGAWEYYQLKSSNSEQIQCYGPASPFYFMLSINSYLKSVLPAAATQETLEDTTSYQSLFWSTDVHPRERDKRALRRTNSAGHKPLSRWKEEHFLDLFWQSYQCIYPLLDEAEFRAHHNSIWIMPYEPRKASALVDIILAVTMQYGTALSRANLKRTTPSEDDKGRDAVAVGLSYYRRCQSLLADELESPSIVTLQCHIFSVIYLSNSGSHNSAHSTLAVACRAAVILGLHREPGLDLDEEKRNLHRRLWWTLYALEIKAAIELGRPLAVSLPEVTCSLPSDSPHTGLVLIQGSPRSPELHNCFAVNLQFLKLILAARSVYVTFYEKSADILRQSQRNTLYGNPDTLEACAEFLSSKMQYLRTWRDDVPKSMKMKRRDHGEPFSTDGSLLDVQLREPFSQQRQQIILELHYHTVAMNLLRHFIYFSKSPGINTPVTEANAVSCVDHAMTITNIIHQMLTETKLLAGWLESFHWHGNAFISLVGYILAFPTSSRTTEARRAIQKAICTFDILSDSLTMAVSAAKMARDLAAGVDIVIDQTQSRSSGDFDGCNVSLNSGGHSMDFATGVALQMPSHPAPSMTSDVEMASDPYWYLGMPNMSNFTNPTGWAINDSQQNPDIWGFDTGFDANYFDLWMPCEPQNLT